jgi:hypothetical protein
VSTESGDAWAVAVRIAGVRMLMVFDAEFEVTWLVQVLQ